MVRAGIRNKEERGKKYETAPEPYTSAAYSRLAHPIHRTGHPDSKGNSAENNADVTDVTVYMTETTLDPPVDPVLSPASLKSRLTLPRDPLRAVTRPLNNLSGDLFGLHLGAIPGSLSTGALSLPTEKHPPPTSNFLSPRGPHYKKERQENEVIEKVYQRLESDLPGIRIRSG